jgi:3-oxoadipate enol-lactonase
VETAETGGEVAQLVEHTAENRGVAGSIPALATPLALLHGLGTGPSAWQPQVDELSGRTVLTPALRLDAGFTIEREASRLWDELPAGQVDLCGLSLGALVALRMALEQPERVRRLILCAGFAALPRRYRVLQAAIGFAAGLVRKDLRAVFREGRRFDVSRELDRLDLPVVVLVGQRDRANRSLSRALASALPNARFEVIPGAGHVANVDAPEAFTDALRSATIPV